MREELAQDVVRSEDVDLVREEELMGSRVEDRVPSSDSSVVDDDRRFSNLSHQTVSLDRRTQWGTTYLCTNLESDGVDSSRVGDIAFVEIDVLYSKKSINTPVLRRRERLRRTSFVRRFGKIKYGNIARNLAQNLDHLHSNPRRSARENDNIPLSLDERINRSIRPTESIPREPV